MANTDERCVAGVGAQAVHAVDTGHCSRIYPHMTSPLPLWSESALLALVSTSERESSVLDFKACEALAIADSKKNELSKDVAAFANAGGGTIIYGIKEEGHIATALDIGFDPAIVTKEWVEQVINSRIQRRIEGIRISQVDLLTTNPGRVAYVIDIPQSLRAPHQSWDKRFYKRFNFESVPMEEYEVRDVSNRSVGPDLQVSFSPAPVPLPPDVNPTAGHWSRLNIRPAIFNRSPVPSEYASVTLLFDERLAFFQGHAGFESSGLTNATVLGTSHSCTTLRLNWGVQTMMPIFEGVPFSLEQRGQLQVAVPALGQYLLGWEVHAPRMQPRSGFQLLTLTASSCELEDFEA